MADQKRAYVYALTAVLLWSTVASAFKLSLRHLDFVELLLYSSLFSSLVLGGLLFGSRRFAEVFQCTKRQYFRSILLGFLNPFLYYLILFKAYDLLPAQEAQPLNYTWALTLSILSVPLLHQRLGLSDVAGLMLGYIGVLVISTGGDVFSFHVSNPAGVGLALGSTVIWALYWIYSTNDTRHPLVCLFLNFTFGLLATAVYYFLFHDVRLPGIHGLMGAAYVGTFEMSITYAVWLSALRLSENTARVAILIFLSPFISLILIHAFLGEHIERSTIFGLVFIVSGLLIQKCGDADKSFPERH